jgi:transposase
VVERGVFQGRGLEYSVVVDLRDVTPLPFWLGVSHLVVTAAAGLVGTVCGMSYPSDLTDEQWAPLEPVFNAPGKRGPKHAPDLRQVVDAMLYVSHTGCQWRYLPEPFGPWTRVWSQFRRWSRNGTWARALTVDVTGLPVSRGASWWVRISVVGL